jgi:starch phosphorylase
MARLTGQYSANRSVREYTERFYIPAGVSYGKRTNEKGELAVQILKWRKELRTHWAEVRVAGVKVNQEVDHLSLQARVHLGAIPPEHIRVEVFADNAEGAPFLADLNLISELDGVKGEFTYGGDIPNSRPMDDYTVRIVGSLDTLAAPLE